MDELRAGFAQAVEQVGPQELLLVGPYELRPELVACPKHLAVDRIDDRAVLPPTLELACQPRRGLPRPHRVDAADIVAKPFQRAHPHATRLPRADVAEIED